MTSSAPPPPVDLDSPPSGWSVRPLGLDDAAEVFAVMAASEQHDIGSVQIEEADIVADWQRPAFDVEAATLGVFEGASLIAYGEHSGGERCDASVRPDRRGRGLGTALAAWVQRTARDAGVARVGMAVPADSDADRLLEALGYDAAWTSWLLELPDGADVPDRPVPPGHEPREARPDEAEAVWRVIDDAFGEWEGRTPEPWGDFEATVLRRPGFAPWMLRVIAEPDTGDVIAAAVVLLSDDVGYVDRLAVRRDRRGRGLAQALLADSFAEARRHGARRLELATDTRSGALGLYRSVGMEVFSTWVQRRIELD